MTFLRHLAFLTDPLARLRAAGRKRRHERRDARRRSVAEAVAARNGMRVLSGPFSGMLYPWLEAAGSQLTPKLLGTYEEEVHPFVERVIRRGYRTVVNLGCGEGYYAVGLARRIPEASVLAFDLDERSQRLCREMAAANDVAGRIRVAGECDPECLREVTPHSALVVCDIEGAEVDLLRPDLVPELLDCDLLVEVHSVKGLRSTGTLLRDRFASTHHAEVVRYRRRNPSRYPAIAFLSRRDRKVAVEEYRRRGRSWMLLLRRDAGSLPCAPGD